METEEVEQVIDEESQDSEINVIPVQFVEQYEGVSLSSPTNSSNIVRGKYYKQTYRQAWEDMPDFKGWLKGVEGVPTRAYCIYCQKTLHAHRLSLLKHTCTLRHQKAAQLYSARKNKENIMENQDLDSVLVKHTIVPQEDIEGECETIIEYAETSLEGEQEIEDDEDAESLKLDQVQFQKHFPQNVSQMGKPPISTHVIDTTKGTPIAGLQVSLYKLIDGRWTYMNEGVTNSSGRFAQFLDRANFTPGRYKLHFDVDRYFEAKKMESLFPFIEIVFDSNLYSDHYHIPVLLSPYGYTTYRGS